MTRIITLNVSVDYHEIFWNYRERNADDVKSESEVGKSVSVQCIKKSDQLTCRMPVTTPC